MASITLTLGSHTVTINRLFTENKYPRKYKDPNGSYDDDPDYVLQREWSFTCLLTPAGATALNNVWSAFVTEWLAERDPKITVTDTTGVLFGATTVFNAWFTKQPEYSEEGAWVRCVVNLQEATADSIRWKGALTISGNGGSLEIRQRYMTDDRYPYGWTDGNFEDDPNYIVRQKWTISCLLTVAEATTLRSIFTTFVNDLKAYEDNPLAPKPDLTVNDNTLFTVSSVKCWFAKPPDFVSDDSEKAKKYNRIVKTSIELIEISADDPNRWAKQITVSNAAGSVVFKQKYMPDDKYPFGYTQPSGGDMDDDAGFTVRRQWEISCRLLKEEADILKAIFDEYVTNNSSSDDSIDEDLLYVSVEDNTLFNITSDRCRFTSPPSFESDDSDEAKRDQRFIKVSFTLEEFADGAGLLKGSITISKGVSVTFKQKHMEEKFPRIGADGSISKVEYVILGASVLDGPCIPVKHQWNLVVNATPEEFAKVIQIENTSNMARINRSNPAISVSDSTTGNKGSYKAVITQYPSVSYNKNSKDRPYRMTFSMQEL